MQEYIANRYARSLYEVCADELEKVAHEFIALLRENDFLSSTRIASAMKVHVVENIGVPVALRNLCKILLTNHRGALCSKVLTEYLKIVKKNRGEIDVLVESYTDLNTKAEKSIIAALVGIFPEFKKVNIVQKINSGLLGGFTIKMNSIMIDLSIIGRLEKYRSMSHGAISEMI
ncbi:ATP synthase F1, delta subunit [Neorickettsia helminthoeca str. Oregon]|uniref:ATP synthase subunit delta n=1 Tax=Neorickettsia helminthoeca str. Oregon TaxID=1286528 RepID=X5HL63_9RICK|nr:ATP synthase F1 subunit delta [Neorickettsia helminthoeca]AHX11090.1 ATP synthase F1, delta subunit [Neorickettsia helminthoeca str. Oregon]